MSIKFSPRSSFRKPTTAFLPFTHLPTLPLRSSRSSGNVIGLKSSEISMESPIVLGAAVAAAAMGGKYLMGAWQVLKTGLSSPRARRFYNGGFEQVMSKREAALILGIREGAVMEKIKEAHRRVMVANHPDAGGSHYLASKINEAKDMLVGRRSTPSPF